MIETTNKFLKRLYNYYHKVSIWIVPTTFIGLYVSIAVIGANIYQLKSENKQDAANNLFEKSSKVYKALGYITTIINVLSCIILFMTIRHAYKITQNQSEDNEEIKRELKLNKRVTLSHITLIVGSTVSAFLFDRPIINFTTYYREVTAYIVLTAIQEMFLSYNMFFILDEAKKLDIIRDEGRNITYPVLTVGKPQEGRLLFSFRN